MLGKEWFRSARFWTITMPIFGIVLWVAVYRGFLTLDPPMPLIWMVSIGGGLLWGHFSFKIFNAIGRGVRARYIKPLYVNGTGYIIGRQPRFGFDFGKETEFYIEWGGKFNYTYNELAEAYNIKLRTFAFKEDVELLLLPKQEEGELVKS